MTWTPARPSAALRAGVAVAALAASGALMLSACSSSSGSSAGGSPSGSVSAAASASGSAGRGQAMAAYRQCLSQHGVNLPTFTRPSGSARPSGRPSGGYGGGGGGGGRGFGGGFPGLGGASPDAATQKALDACKGLRPQFNGQRGAGANSSAFQAFTSCLKDHGVTLPSPGAAGGAGGAAGAGGAGGAGGAAGGRGAGGFRGLNTSDPTTAKAYETCKALLPQRGSGGGSSASPSAT